MAKTIGICIPTIEGGVICHQEIGREASRRGIEYPEIVTHTPPYAGIRKAVENDDLSDLPETLIKSIGVLGRAGAELAIIPSNTMHLVFDRVSAGSAVPILNIAAVAAEFCRSKGFARVGVLGTASTMKRGLFDPYLEQRGIHAVYPSVFDMETLTRIIADELVRGRFEKRSTEILLEICARIYQHADALILGCTELPLVITQENCAAPLIDTTRLLAHAALDFATMSSKIYAFGGAS
jgi:aspartate racemase